MSPLKIAVTGHRDLLHEDLNKILRHLKQKFVELQRSQHNNDETQLVMLTGMAPGADTIAAQVVLKLASENPEQFAVQPVLPFPEEHFLHSTTFDDEHQKNTYRKLVSEIFQVCGNRPLVVPVAAEIRVTDGELPNIVAGNDFRDSRRAYYAALGAYLAQQAQILIALLDPHEDTAATGGTWDVVQMKLNGIRPGLIVGNSKPTKADPLGIVWHLPVRRLKYAGKHGYNYPTEMIFRPLKTL